MLDSWIDKFLTNNCFAYFSDIGNAIYSAFKHEKKNWKYFHIIMIIKGQRVTVYFLIEAIVSVILIS